MKKKNISKQNLVRKIVDEFLIKKEGKSILKNIEKKNLLREGIIDSLDLLTLSSLLEKKTGVKINITSPKIYNKFSNYNKLIKILS
jgi:acyl carrier protein|tara:strand:- start:1943 stop:2200 length:258 start_codon:yes stop_codon:yes gene_type:complete